jgi:hypothetical protein
MRIYSNNPIPDKLKWKGAEMLIAINKKENAVVSEEDEGCRFEADFTIAKIDEPETIVKSVNRMFSDAEFDNEIVYGFSENTTGDISNDIPIVSNVEVLFDNSFLKQKETISALKGNADENIKKLAGNIKNYIADLTDGVRTSATDLDVQSLIDDNNIIITNE